jgi:hypothetical protein
MPFVPVPNTAMVELLYTLDSQELENTLYFEGVAPWDATTLQQLALVLITWWVGEYGPLVSSALQFRGVKATSLESETAPGIEQPPATPQSGGDAAEVMPNNVTAAIKFVTALRGRSGRGRNYIAGLTTDDCSGNLFSSTTATSFVNAYNALLDLTYPNDAQWVVVSRISEGEERATGLTSPVLNAAFADLILDSQRRRLPGRGT